MFDNASTDATCEIIARDYPWAKLQRSAKNLGFARANNEVIRTTCADACLLLNPDVVLEDKQALAAMLDVLEANPSIGMVGPRLTFADGTHQVGDAGYRPSPRNMIRHGLGAAHLRSSVVGFCVVRPDRYRHSIVDVDWICGACLLIRRSVIEQAGGLDERLFLYAEDVEWGCRIRRYGQRVVYLPWSRVVHLQGMSEAKVSGHTDHVPVRWLQSLLGLYSAENDGRWLGTVRAAFALGFATRFVVYSGFAALGRGPRYRHKAIAMLAYARASATFRVAPELDQPRTPSQSCTVASEFRKV